MIKPHLEPPPRSHALGVKYVSFNETSGYGHAARSYLLGLAQSDIPLTWTPMVMKGFFRPRYRLFREGGVGDPQLDRLCNRAIAYNQVLIHLVPEYIPYW